MRFSRLSIATLAIGNAGGCNLTYESAKGCLQRAKSHGLKFTVENHTHTMVPDPTAFLRLWDAIRAPALGMNLDVRWVALQREYPPVAVRFQGFLNIEQDPLPGDMKATCARYLAMMKELLA